MSQTALLVKETDADVPPTGRWRHDLCDCCGGPNCCPAGLAFFLCTPCSSIALLTCIPCMIGQIAGRASYRPNCCGQHRTPIGTVPTSTRSNCMQACMVAFILFLIPWIVDAVEIITTLSTYVPLILWTFGHRRHYNPSPYNNYYIGPEPFDPEPYVTFSIGSYILRIVSGIITFIFAITCLIFLSNLRSFIRFRYSLNPDWGCDCCVMLFCLPCAISQMYRHVYPHNRGCIFTDPGPHPELPNTLPPGTMITQQVVITAQPGVVAAQPGVVTAQPGVVTAQPGVVVAQPGVVTAQPGVATQQVMTSFTQ